MIRLPRITRPIAISAVLMVLAWTGAQSDGSAYSDARLQPVTSEAEPIDWRWAITQGGLTLVVLVLLWSYRKDMQRWQADSVVAQERADREQRGFDQSRIDEAIRYHRAVESLSSRTDATLQLVAEALSGHSTVIARNTDAVHRTAKEAERLDRRMELIERLINDIRRGDPNDRSRAPLA